jgi:hypothetical protein
MSSNVRITAVHTMNAVWHLSIPERLSALELHYLPSIENIPFRIDAAGHRK